ncbi:Restriction endonuclease type II-like [Acididesulfobacillus acetoxydans]|uniref:Endonuclease, Uma2 (Restriction endonuclease fold) n=1 Tax=Acididesulfobacillus acetoxydans TaxID=1561005 RepID=A0A8S0XAX1_9FIRM|nr:Uma2 family endonuclease [Acididesulfobacillus acetoxydans]CAA7600506.1 Restriction endonuclease type II-like [Acididesulfobacillus acetoxydans]CEJ06640.1 Endonuclease, Uma2 (Restriction endonuclease fold) [Acididesulfobacillus acetoxydans]
MPIPQSNKKYNYADYLNWPKGERWEIIDGVPYMQSAPTWQHQAVSGNIFAQFHGYLKDKPCRVFAAPFDVCIPEADESDEDISNVISQPDIAIVCDQGKLRKTGYFGIPLIIVEIVSPSTAKNDKLTKFNAFEKAGVREYWLVEPEIMLVNVFVLQENKRYGRPEIYSNEDKIKVNSFPDFEVDLAAVFANL